jgi:hypothetical protein
MPTIKPNTTPAAAPPIPNNNLAFANWRDTKTLLTGAFLLQAPQYLFQPSNFA